MENLTEEQRRIVDGIVSNPSYIVPFIGENAFYYQKDKESEKISIQQFIVEKFAEHNSEQFTDDEKAVFMNGYYGLSKLKKKYLKGYKYNFVRFIYEEGYGKIHLRESIKDFLISFKFPFIVTTCCFDFLERELHYKPITYKLDSQNDTLEDTHNVVYHIYGYVDSEKRNEKGNEWVCDEWALLYYMKSLNNNDTSPKGLAAHIKSKPLKRVLFLGCSFPNWIFRFMWTPFNEKNVYSDDESGYWLGKIEEGTGLSDFFEDIGYLNDEVVDIILKEATAKHSKKNNLMQENLENLSHNCDYDIFLSYASDDTEVMEKIKEILENKNNLRVWSASAETQKGGDYWIRIQEGIEKSRYFMPIITSTYLERFLSTERLTGDEEESGLETETKKAAKWFNDEKSHPRWDVYSLPVILLDEKFGKNNSDVDSNLVERYANGRCGMPQSLYFHVHMFYFSMEEKDVRDTFSKKDWSIYKNIHR